MKQTAVEWLINRLGKSGFDFSSNQGNIQKAKEIEKQQIIEAYDEAEGKIIGRGEQYYNEQFKNK